MSLLADAISWALILCGACATVAGAVGLLRFPDVFARMHGAGVTDTLGAALIVLGLAVQAGPTLIAVKLLMILLFLFFTSPTASYALANAALSQGLKPKAETYDGDRPGSGSSNS